MFYTDDTESAVLLLDAMQVFAVEVKEIKCGLQWPIQVFGHVALRDLIDCMRNLIFSRGRDNYQTLTKEDSSLVLTGPSRPALAAELIDFEIELKVKGITQADDKVLSLMTFDYNTLMGDGGVERQMRSNKYSTLEVTFARLERTVEATVHVKIVDGSFGHRRPKNFACTHHLPWMKFVLLDPREDAMVVADDGGVKLTRSVVSVEMDGGLKITVQVQEDGKTVHVGSTTFKPQKFGKADNMLELSFCKMSFTVAWSQIAI